MIGCLRTCVRKQPITALYFESENEFKFYNLEARLWLSRLLKSYAITQWVRFLLVHANTECVDVTARICSHASAFTVRIVAGPNGTGHRKRYSIPVYDTGINIRTGRTLII